MMAGEIGPAHRDADAVVALGQRAHQMAAEEAGASENGHEGFHIRGHGTALRGAECRVFRKSGYRFCEQVYAQIARSLCRPNSGPASLAVSGAQESAHDRLGPR